MLRLPTLLLAIAFSLPAQAGELELLKVSQDSKGFVTEKSQRPFVPFGVNYDHDEAGRLLEDYWVSEWPKVEEDFREIKDLGANVVRIHLQFGKFMEAADRPNEAALLQLEKLVQLAERTGLYLDLTGLGCYHKADVPAWYDELDEAARWNAQAQFWEAVSARCSKSSAIFFYDLMNEPVVAGGKDRAADWLGPAFGDKHFVQLITRETKGRARPEVARAWIEKLVAAIRKHDKQHLVSVGLVDWSLDRPGLTSGFVPQKVAEPLDFICVHVYPETGKLDEAKRTIDGFHVGKPVIVEETFPLKCSPAELTQFMDESSAAGWISFYWGAQPDELRKKNDIGSAITAQWLEAFRSRAQRLAKNAPKPTAQ